MGAGACKSGGGGSAEAPKQMRRGGGNKTLAEKISLQAGVKIVLLGSASTGKTSIVLRLTHNQFVGECMASPTVGVSFLAHTLLVDGQYIKLEVWDTAGQERYRALVPMYYRDAVAAVVVYDITDAESFEVAKQWVEEMHQRADPHIVIAFVGNKTDLDTKRVVATEQGTSFVRSLEGTGMCAFATECSAKSGDGVQDLFVNLGRTIIDLSKRGNV